MFEKDKILVLENHRDEFIAFSAKRALAKLSVLNPELTSLIQQDNYIGSEGITIIFGYGDNDCIDTDITWNELSMSKEDFESHIQAGKRKNLGNRLRVEGNLTKI